MRPIDADAYAAEMKTRQDELKELMDDADALGNWDMYYGLSRAFSVFVEAKLTLDAMPTIDAVLMVHGEWIWDIDGMDWGIGSWRCNKCHARPNTYWQRDSTINPLMFASSSYCPNCGAKMDAKEGTEE